HELRREISFSKLPDTSGFDRREIGHRASQSVEAFRTSVPALGVFHLFGVRTSQRIWPLEALLAAFEPLAYPGCDAAWSPPTRCSPVCTWCVRTFPSHHKQPLLGDYFETVLRNQRF